MRKKELPYQTFLDTFKLVPRVAISLVILNPYSDILLTKRSINPFKNKWHLPGSFILKGETINECINRIGRKELGVNLQFMAKRFLVVNNTLKDDPRGHVVELLYEVYNLKNIDIPKLCNSGETVTASFFSSPPKDMGFHKTIIKSIFNDSIDD